MDHKYEWTEDKSGKLSMSAEISGLAEPSKRVMAHLIPNTGKDAERGSYITDIERNFLDAGHGAVDVRNAAEGKAFLENWGDKIAMPEMERLQSKGAMRRHEHETAQHVDRAQEAWDRMQEQRDHDQE